MKTILIYCRNRENLSTGELLMSFRSCQSQPRR